MDKVGRWKAAVWSLYCAALVLAQENEDITDADILGDGMSRKERTRVAHWLESIDQWASTDTKRFTLPGLLLGTNLHEFVQAESLQEASNEDVVADAEAIIKRSASPDGQK